MLRLEKQTENNPCTQRTSSTSILDHSIYSGSSTPACTHTFIILLIACTLIGSSHCYGRPITRDRETMLCAVSIAAGPVQWRPVPLASTPRLSFSTTIYVALFTSPGCSAQWWCSSPRSSPPEIIIQAPDQCKLVSKPQISQQLCVC